jgi:hypothetical protein
MLGWIRSTGLRGLALMACTTPNLEVMEEEGRGGRQPKSEDLNGKTETHQHSYGVHETV